MTKISGLNDLQIYRESLFISQKIYLLCKSSKLKYEYSLQDQIKRASISIAANIAEGYGRNTRKDFAQFLSIALGSANEVIAYLDFISLQFSLDTEEAISMVQTICNRIIAFRRYLLTSPKTS